MVTPKDKYSDFAEHPRYGKRPHFTDLNPVPKSGSGVWLNGYSTKKTRIPNTAIVASCLRQNAGLGHVTHYFDEIFDCEDCGRKFIFFAQEQRHWYEVLRFNLSAYCRNCVDCRKSHQGIAKLRARHDFLLDLEGRTEKETLELVSCSIALVEQKVFGSRVIQRIRQLLNQFPLDSKTRRQATYRDLMTRSKKLL